MKNMENFLRDGEVKRQTEAEEKGFEPIEGYVTIFIDGNEITRKVRYDYDTSPEHIQEKIAETAKDMAETLTRK